MADDSKAPAAKTKPVDAGPQRYKVTGKVFINGNMIDPSTHSEITAPDGLEGASLKKIGPAKPALPSDPNANG